MKVASRWRYLYQAVDQFGQVIDVLLSEHATWWNVAGVPRATTRERMLAELPVAERRLQLAGISSAVLEGGDGPPVLLLHGPGEFAALWARAIPDLATTHGVVAPDLPGHGASGYQTAC